MQHHLNFDSAILIGPLPRICSDCTVRAFVNCFVPGWCARRTSSPLWRRGENALRVADNLYGFRPREGRSPAELWKAFGRSIPFLDKHLRNTAYLLASEIWNEDEIRAERYRDCLLRWLDTLRPEMQTDILLSHHALLTPDLFALDWAAVQTRLQAYRRLGQNCRRPKRCSPLFCAASSMTCCSLRRARARLACQWAAIERHRCARGNVAAPTPGHRRRRITLCAWRHAASDRIPLALFAARPRGARRTVRERRLRREP